MMPCLGCGIPTRGSRCSLCNAQYQEKIIRIRPSSNARGYDYAWQKVRLAVLRRDNWTCYYCQKILIKSDATVDHRIALSKGGDRLNQDNLVASCRSCNSSKKDK